MDLISETQKTIPVRDYDFTFVGGVHVSFTLPVIEGVNPIQESAVDILIKMGQEKKRIMKAHLLFVETRDRMQIIADPKKPSSHATTPTTQS
jgi:hypothetical protein